MDRIAVLMGQEKRRSFKETLDVKRIKIEKYPFGSQRRAKEEIARNTVPYLHPGTDPQVPS